MLVLFFQIGISRSWRSLHFTVAYVILSLKGVNEMIMSDAQFGELYEYLGSEPTCDHTLRYTVDWLKEHHLQDIRGTIEKIVDLGGHCDCEVLLNVTPDIWEERRDEEITG